MRLKTAKEMEESQITVGPSTTLVARKTKGASEATGSMFSVRKRR